MFWYRRIWTLGNGIYKPYKLQSIFEAIIEDDQQSTATAVLGAIVRTIQVTLVILLVLEYEILILCNWFVFNSCYPGNCSCFSMHRLCYSSKVWYLGVCACEWLLTCCWEVACGWVSKVEGGAHWWKVVFEFVMSSRFICFPPLYINLFFISCLFIPFLILLAVIWQQ